MLQGRSQTLNSLAKGVWIRSSGSLRVAGLAGILLFSFWTGMGPHWDYPYPLHVDEWFAIGYAQATLDAEGLRYQNPYGPWEISFHPEMGFHLLLGFLKTATGLSWMGLYRVAPGVQLAFLAFLTYVFARRLGFGWAAALFIPLIPASIRTLGPAFIVPVSAAMLFIPLTLLVLHTMGEEDRGKSLWILLLLIGGTIFVHPTTEVVVTGLAVMYLGALVVSSLARRQYGKAANLLLALGVRMAIPVVILGLWIPSLTKQVLAQSTSGSGGLISLVGPHTGFLEAFGIVAVAVSILGLFLFVSRGEYGAQSYILPVFTGLLLAFQLLVFPQYRLGPEVLYSRGWLYLGLLLAILAGYGVALYFRSIAAIAKAVASRLPWPHSDRVAVPLWFIGIAVVLSVLVTGLATNQDRQRYTFYYHVINESNFSDFVALGEHTAPGQAVAFAEPSMAWAYPPVAGPGETVYQAVSSPWSNARADKMREILESGDVDVEWLRQQGVSVLYTCWPRTNRCRELTSDELFKVRTGVYFVPNHSDTG